MNRPCTVKHMKIKDKTLEIKRRSAQSKRVKYRNKQWSRHTWATIAELTSISGFSGYGIMRGYRLVQNRPHISPECEMSENITLIFTFHHRPAYILIANIYSIICH